MTNHTERAPHAKPSPALRPKKAATKNSPDGLRLDPANANRGTERGRRSVGRSLAECGAGRSILVDSNDATIGGAKTLEAAREVGLPVTVEKRRRRAHRGPAHRLGPRHDERARRLAYLDNRASELGLEWDREQLLADLTAGVDLSGIFRSIELEELLAPVATWRPRQLPELPETTTTARRPLLLWPSRVRCGDATEPADVARLLGGARPRMLVKIRPTGSSSTWSGATAPASTSSGAAEKSYLREQSRWPDLGDTIADWSAALSSCASLEVAYVWHATSTCARWQTVLSASASSCASSSSGSNRTR